MYFIVPNFAGLFLLASLPAVAAFAIGGILWVARGKGQRVWRALWVVVGLPFVVAAHVVISLALSFLPPLVLVWALLSCFFVAWAWRFASDPEDAPNSVNPTVARARNVVGVAGFGLLSAWQLYLWFGPVLPAPQADRVVAKPAAASYAPTDVPALFLSWRDLPDTPWSLDPMTPEEVAFSLAQTDETKCPTWLYRDVEGSRKPVAMIVTSNEHAKYAEPSVVKLNQRLRTVQFGPDWGRRWPDHVDGDFRTPRHTGMVVWDFTPLPRSTPVTEASLRVAYGGAGLSLTSDDLYVTSRRTGCTIGAGICRRYAGSFNARWVPPRNDSYRKDAPPPAAFPSIRLEVEEPCFGGSRGNVVMPEDRVLPFGKAWFRFWDMGP